MKNLISLLFLVSVCQSGILNNGYAEDIHKVDQYKIDYVAKDDHNKNYEECRYSDVETGNDKNDDEGYNRELYEEMIRPCVVDDLDCIRKFLAANSDCKLQHGPKPDPLIIPYDKLFFPFVNLTITSINLHVEGFKSAKITEFYVNKYTGYLVFAINVRKLTLTTPKSYFAYRRTAKETIVLSDFTSVTYDSITFTVVIPKIPHLKLELAEVNADVHDGTPSYVIGPRAYNSTDPDVVSAYSQFIANISIAIREAFAFQSYLLSGVFIEKTLCDFGVDVYKNYLHFINTKAFTNVPEQLLNGLVVKKD